MERRDESARTPPGWHTCLLPPQTFLAPDSVGRWSQGGSREGDDVLCRNLPSPPSSWCGPREPGEEQEQRGSRLRRPHWCVSWKLVRSSRTPTGLHSAEGDREQLEGENRLFGLVWCLGFCLFVF